MNRLDLEMMAIYDQREDGDIQLQQQDDTVQEGGIHLEGVPDRLDLRLLLFDQLLTNRIVRSLVYWIGPSEISA
jgi:hypothetical protein